MLTLFCVKKLNPNPNPLSPAREGEGGGWWKGEIPYFSYTKLCCCMDRVWFPKIPRVYN